MILHLAYLELRCNLKGHGMIVFSEDDNRRGHKTFCDYSITQAVGFSLFAIGLFSLTYHVCPSRAIFQLDTNGMFLCATLIIVAVFHGWSWSPMDEPALTWIL